MANKSFTRSLTKDLMAYLKSNMPSIIAAYDEFPNPQQKLKFPSFSIFLQKPNFTPEIPYVLSVGAPITTGEDINKGVVKRVVGKYDYNIQIDFWCESKVQRHDIYQEFIEAINSGVPTSGLTFVMEDYHNEFVHFDVKDVSFAEDSEISSQRNEWRFKVSVVGNARCVKETLEVLMTNVESTIDTAND